MQEKRKFQLFPGLTMDAAEHFAPERYKHWVDDHVRFGDLDPLGHVNNNATGQYFENARALFFMKVTPQWPHRDTLFVLVRSATDFHRELHMPAELRIGTAVKNVGRTSLTLANALFRHNDGIAFCESVSVLINRTTRKPVEIPADLRSVLMEYAL